MGSKLPSSVHLSGPPLWSNHFRGPSTPPPEPTSPIAAQKAKIARIKRAATAADARVERDLEEIRRLTRGD